MCQLCQHFPRACELKYLKCVSQQPPENGRNMQVFFFFSQCLSLLPLYCPLLKSIFPDSYTHLHTLKANLVEERLIFWLVFGTS